MAVVLLDRLQDFHLCVFLRCGSNSQLKRHGCGRSLTLLYVLAVTIADSFSLWTLSGKFCYEELDRYLERCLLINLTWEGIVLACGTCPISSYKFQP